jgi:hypothetical protein
VLALALVPRPASATLRGVWDFITNGGAFNTGLPHGAQQPALRPGATFSTGGHQTVEQWFAFTTRSTVVGHEGSRSIWLARNQDQIGFRVTDILDARRPLLRDPTALISYNDPAWSPDGRYLAYVETDAGATRTSIYVQEYLLGNDAATASTAVGEPLLVVPHTFGRLTLSPAWNAAGDAIAFSSAAGGTRDIWVVSIDAPSRTVGTPVRVTFDNLRSETEPSWGPGGRIVYATNKFGPIALEIVNIDDGTFTMAETNFIPISHRNPSFSPDGAAIYYEAAEDENPDLNPNIWRLDLANQTKCEIFLDTYGDSDPDVSRITNTTTDGIPYHTFLMSSQAAGFGICIWRGSAVACAPELPLGVRITPSVLNRDSNGNNITVTVTMPPEVRALGYRAYVDVFDHGKGIPAGFEGIKNRTTILASPTFLGMTAPISAINGSPIASIDNVGKAGEEAFQMNMDRKAVEAHLVGLGLVDQDVECRVTAYSNLKGRQFVGYGYFRLSSATKSGQTARLEQNSPNPFNPRTNIRFSLAKAGRVAVRVFDAHGGLVATVAQGHYPSGSHQVAWDGHSARGRVASGIYFARADALEEDGAIVSSNVVKMVMAK